MRQPLLVFYSFVSLIVLSPSLVAHAGGECGAGEALAKGGPRGDREGMGRTGVAKMNRRVKC